MLFLPSRTSGSGSFPRILAKIVDQIEEKLERSRNVIQRLKFWLSSCRGSIQGWIVVNGVNFGDKNWGSSLKFALKFAREFYRFSTVGWLRTTALDRRVLRHASVNSYGLLVFVRDIPDFLQEFIYSCVRLLRDVGYRTGINVIVPFRDIRWSGGPRHCI